MAFFGHYGDFPEDTAMNRRTNIVMDDGGVHPLAKTLPCLLINL